MKARNTAYLRFCFIPLLLCATACASLTTTQSTSGIEYPEPPTTVPMVTVTQTPIGTPTSSATLKNIAEAEIHSVWWSADASTLFYRTYEKILAYDVVSEQVREVSSEEFYQPTIQPEIVSELPTEANRVFVSPCGNHALYFTFIDIPPTPEGELGEYLHLGITAELWFHEKGATSRRLVEMEYCYPNGVLWAHDEQSLIVEHTDPLIRCEENYVWLITLHNDAIYPLLPVETYSSPVSLIDFSPNDKQLLFNVSDQEGEGSYGLSLFSLNLDTFQIFQLGTPPVSAGDAWLTDEKVLIYYQQLPETSWTVGIFDLATANLVELTPSFGDLCMAMRTVSPDRRKFAFTTGADCSYMDNLWLLELNLDS